jgi:hypothetical protein
MRNKHHRPAFVTTVVMTAAAAGLAAMPLGCQNQVTANPSPPVCDETDSCAPPACPAKAPAPGAICVGSPAAGCAYTAEDECGMPTSVQADCVDGTWRTSVVGGLSCNPPPPEACPEAIPDSGDFCNPDSLGKNCDYPDPNCGSLTFVCQLDGWQLVTSPCNPPPPCSVWSDEKSCDAMDACAWVTDLDEAKCHTRCKTTDECGEGSACVTMDKFTSCDADCVTVSVCK